MKLSKMVLQYADQEIEDPKVHLAKLRKARDAFALKVRRRLDASDRKTFDDLLDVARANYPLTEDHNYWVDGLAERILYPIFEEFGKRLLRLGILYEIDDVWFLHTHELLLWGGGVRNPLKPTIAKRRKVYAKRKKLTPPPYLGQPPKKKRKRKINQDRYWGPAEPQELEPWRIKGIGASPRIVRGRARKLHNIRQASGLKSGEILVCKLTDPTWTALFGVAGALVTDEGGSLCHGAVVAREYRLPAVVGTRVATSRSEMVSSSRSTARGALSSRRATRISRSDIQ